MTFFCSYASHLLSFPHHNSRRLASHSISLFKRSTHDLSAATTNSNANNSRDERPVTEISIPDEFAPGVKTIVRLDKFEHVASYSIVYPERVTYNDGALRKFDQRHPWGASLARRMYQRLRGDQTAIKTFMASRVVPTVDHTVGLCLDSAANNLYPQARKALLRADVVARAADIRRLMHGHGEFYASYVDGKLFIEAKAERHDADLEKYLRESLFGELISYNPNYPAGPSSFNAIVTRNLGGLRLLMSGPIDCYHGGSGGHASSYVQAYCPHASQWNSKRMKNVYLSLQLMGIRQLYLGLRTEDNRTVSSNYFIQTTDLLQLIRTESAQWDTQDIMNRGFRSLCVIRDYLQACTDQLEFRGRKRGWARSRDPEHRAWHIQIAAKRNSDTDDGKGKGKVVRIRELSKAELDVYNAAKNGGREVPRTGILPRAVVRNLRASIP